MIAKSVVFVVEIFMDTVLVGDEGYVWKFVDLKYLWNEWCEIKKGTLNAIFTELENGVVIFTILQFEFS